ncbi:laccase [Moniliophthora roreri MCA 2997]|uniref:Laccase n=1 Tax=Moniliophthora roreri (strain MCA 2997) TaxID=1381753 RepID=V2X2F4_MONRO|nr:laccase [Moniliophthora roreri MCA 2997]
MTAMVITRIVALAFLLLSNKGSSRTSSPVTVSDLRILNTEVSPDGFPRLGIVAEGSFPGPVISGQKGDSFEINVINDLTEESMLTSTSIHWHGLHVKGSNWADGTASVTQCPITAGHAFLYKFRAGNQAGTYWYHSHLASQYCDGLRGPLIIYDLEDPHASLYDVDDKHTIITLSDWYRRYQGGPKSPLAVINVESGKRYRLRIISMSCDPFFTFSIDGHNFTIIEADGVNTEPVVVEAFEIFAGQRYSAILHASQDINNYWIRANTSKGPGGFEGGINQAILRYRGAPFLEPTDSHTTPLRFLRETDLHPLEDPEAPGAPDTDGADISINLVFEKVWLFSSLLARVNFGPQDVEKGKYLMNGVPYVPPTIPVLLQILSMASDVASLIPAKSIYYLPPNKTVQISMPIGDVPGNPHPMHLHGHTFSVVRSAGSSEYNYVNPVRRDVVSAGDKNDNVTFRFRTDNSGPWFFHCHIDGHLERGMAVVFAEDVSGVASANPVPNSWRKLCPIYEAQYDIWTQDKLL